MFTFGTFGHLVVSCFILNPCTVTISIAFSEEIHSFHEQMGKAHFGLSPWDANELYLQGAFLYRKSTLLTKGF